MSENLPEAIGPYRIESKLGQGGMGAVFKGVHDTLERPAAVKLLPPELAQNPEYVSRFLREARTVATLKDGNIVQVYDAGAFEGKYFIAMELIEGQSLNDYLDKEGKLNEKEGMRLMMQAARGLATAHQKGLVHRDIKPENMLLDKDMNLHLVDFGLVMETASQTQLTATGACLGTPMYMSPEQTDGEKADERSDVYSLGVTFYRALVGTPPFSSPTVMNLLFKHRFEAPPDPRSLRPDLSKNACNILLTMMAKPREDRPQNGAAVVELLEMYEKGKKVPEPPPFRSPMTSTGMSAQSGSGVSEATSSDSTRKLIMIGVAAAVFILLVSGIALWALVFRSAGKPQTAEAKKEQTTTVQEEPANKGSGSQKSESSRRQQLIQQARELEAAGRLAEAVAAYEQALEIESDGPLTAKIRSLHTQIAAANKPPVEKVEKFENVEPVEKKASLPPAPDPGMELAKDAQQLLARNDFALAAVKYEEAAQITKNADLKKVYINRAKDCRRQGYLKEVETLKAKQDWAGAAAALSQALSISPDPALELQRDALVTKAKNETDFRGYIKSGDEAMAKGEYVPARVNYQLALRVKPGAPEATTKLSEANGRLALIAGDTARDKGDLAAARIEYSRAAELCAALRTEATQRLVNLQQRQVSSTKITAEVDRMVREGRTAEGHTKLAAALRANPSSQELLNLKQGLDALQTCEKVFRRLKPILQQGQTAATEARGIDSSDGEARRLGESMQAKAFKCDTLAAQARTHFQSRANAQLLALVTEAKTLALTAGGEMEGAGSRYRRKATEAEDFKGVNAGLFKIGVKGNKAKAARYRRVADTFDTLGQQARALSH